METNCHISCARRKKTCSRFCSKLDDLGISRFLFCHGNIVSSRIQKVLMMMALVIVLTSTILSYRDQFEKYPLITTILVLIITASIMNLSLIIIKCIYASRDFFHLLCWIFVITVILISSFYMGSSIIDAVLPSIQEYTDRPQYVVFVTCVASILNIVSCWILCILAQSYSFIEQYKNAHYYVMIHEKLTVKNMVHMVNMPAELVDIILSY